MRPRSIALLLGIGLLAAGARAQTAIRLGEIADAGSLREELAGAWVGAGFRVVGPLDGEADREVRGRLVSGEAGRTLVLEASGPDGGEGRSVQAVLPRHGRPEPEVLLGLLHDLGFALAGGREPFLAARAVEDDEALALLDRAAAADPAWAWPLVRGAQIHRKAGRLPEALEASRAARLREPALGEAANEEGLALYLSGRRDEAMVAWESAIEIDPSHVQALHNLSVLLREKIETERAIPLAQRALELDPEYAAGWHNLGCCYYVEGRLEEAALGFRRSIELASGLLASRVMLATCLYDLERMDECEAALRELLEMREDDQAGHYYLGLVLSRSDDRERLQEALRHFERYLADGGDDGRVRGWMDGVQKKLQE